MLFVFLYCTGSWRSEPDHLQRTRFERIKKADQQHQQKPFRVSHSGLFVQDILSSIDCCQKQIFRLLDVKNNCRIFFRHLTPTHQQTGVTVKAHQQCMNYMRTANRPHPLPTHPSAMRRISHSKGSWHAHIWKVEVDDTPSVSQKELCDSSVSPGHCWSVTAGWLDSEPNSTFWEAAQRWYRKTDRWPCRLPGYDLAGFFSASASWQVRGTRENAIRSH